jgi:hypothetical protein
VRRKQQSQKGQFQSSTHKNQPRKWIDLAFLQKISPSDSDDEKYGIYDAQMTLVICGSQNSKWVAWAFADACADDEEDEDEDEDDDGEEEEDEDENDRYAGFHSDPIASAESRDSNLPFWDPREYFLTVFNLRIARIQNEWLNIVRELHRRVTGNVRRVLNSYRCAFLLMN